jgi:hypothetical protein
LEIFTPGSLSKLPGRKRKLLGSLSFRFTNGVPQRPQNTR